METKGFFTGAGSYMEKIVPGTGKSVANYVPVANFLAMLEEGRHSGVYRRGG